MLVFIKQACDNVSYNRMLNDSAEGVCTIVT